jgi:hypothetical protein
VAAILRGRINPRQRTLGGSTFWLCATAAVSRRIGSVNRFGDDALKAELAGVLQNELAVADVVAIELQARLVREQQLKKRLALD